ncbi:glutathione-disulfide reductase [Novosphingobium sp. 1949]|uniref:Glutathione reductase n=1 Tax=Novosphingobium organovorum TaxID=2930092 RepID=A0ABT0BDD0_9SPHN|nr:glutathione-disulfide reductase [Novosphingobium organovorum]MCJ2183032.1 glutathione-disulfide reductase [Novosphingobium organovorum]
MSDYDYDLFTIGAGSGGVRASRIAASHGARVAVAEEYRVGGTCVIRGCVPKKMLVYGAQFAEDLEHAKRFGWEIGEARFDWATLRDNVLADVDRLNGLYTQGLDSAKVEVIPQRATLSGPHEVTLANGEKKTARHILIATGGRPFVPSFEGSEHGITSNEAFHLEELPARVLIAGAGYIANEFAGVFHALGSKVTIVNRSDQILRGYDESVRERLVQISQAKGIEFRFQASFEKIVKNADGSLTVSMTNHDPIEVDCVLFATGRVPNVEGLGLEAVGVVTNERGAIAVDAYARTNVEGIYAVGDVTDRVQLTPVAIREGHAFADTVFGNNPRTIDYDAIPTAVFSHPPIGAVGLTEAEARAKFGTCTVYTSEFRPMKNALTQSSERALYKMVCHAETGVVLGLHMIGPDSAEIMQAAAIAVKAGLTKADFDATVALHPTLAEELVLLK